MNQSIRRTAAIAAFSILGMVAVYLAGGIGRGGVTFERASNEYVTNCDLGHGCGSVQLLKLAVVIGALSVIVLFVQQRWRRWRDR